MSRYGGFPNADVDVGLLDDSKVRKLARRLDDPAAINAAVVSFIAVLLASWEAGERVSSEEATPAWMDRPEIKDLVSVGLLDDDGRIPEHAWENWYRPAHERRLMGIRRSIFAGLRRQGFSIEAANAEADRRVQLSSLKAQPRSLSTSSLKAHPPTVRPSDRPTDRSEEEEEEAASVGQRESAPPDAAYGSGGLDMDHLHEAPLETLRGFLHGLSRKDARYRPIQNEIASREAPR